MEKLFIISVILFLFVGCGGALNAQSVNSSTDSDVYIAPSGGGHIAINKVEYPVYSGMKFDSNILTFHTYKVKEDAEEVFAWYIQKMFDEGWTILLEESDGKTGQRTYQRGDANDISSLEFVIVNIFQDGDDTVLNITPQPNRYRK